MKTNAASQWAVVLLACAAVLAGDRPAAGQSQADVHAVARKAFAERIQQYAALRARFEEPLPAFDARRDPWTLFLMRRYLASAIRTRRASAEVGDIFTPPVAALFRATIDRAVQEIDMEGLVDDEFTIDDFLIDLTINEPLPVWALQPLPASLAGRLPALPEAIEYCLVGTALVLWDNRAEILIDALPNAF